MPVIDQTGLAGNFIYDLWWNEPDGKHANTKGLEVVVRNQLGLELVPTNLPIEMLLVDQPRKK